MKNKRKKIPNKDDKLSSVNPLKCCKCEKTFRFKSEKIRHELSHSIRYKCKVCNKDFGFISALKRHEKQHNRSESVQCHECNKQFKDETLLQRHMKYAHGETYSCQMCEVIFYSKLALSSHKKSHKPTSERVYRCDHPGCSKSFNFPHHLKHHKLAHEGKKQYYCNLCFKGFIQLHYLKSHIKTHQPTNWLECPEIGCNKKFATDYALKKHLARHGRRNDVTKSHELTAQRNEADNCLVKTSNLIGASNETIHNLECDELCSSSTPQTVHHDTSEPENILSDCQTALGACIVTGDTGYDEDCVCAKIPNCSVEDSATYGELNTVNQTNNLNECKNITCSPSTTCSVSECQSRFASNECRNITVPQFEYKSNGAVKLINTFDLEVNDVSETNNNDIICGRTVTSRELPVPYNSCKAVLGNCIVSGDGTMAEGCLCAKMSCMDSQDFTEQQINELSIVPLEDGISSKLL